MYYLFMTLYAIACFMYMTSPLIDWSAIHLRPQVATPKVVYQPNSIGVYLGLLIGFGFIAFFLYGVSNGTAFH